MVEELVPCYNKIPAINDCYNEIAVYVNLRITGEVILSDHFTSKDSNFSNR